MGGLPLCEPAAATILLIDANDKDRTYYAERIRIGLLDCHVLEAKHGNSGLELYKSHSVDCTVTELHLPDMSGFALLLKVVPQVRQPQVAFIILARIAWKSLANIAQTNGAQAFLAKRLTAGDELVPLIQKAIATVGRSRKDRQQ